MNLLSLSHAFTNWHSLYRHLSTVHPARLTGLTLSHNPLLGMRGLWDRVVDWYDAEVVPPHMSVGRQAAVDAIWALAAFLLYCIYKKLR